MLSIGKFSEARLRAGAAAWQVPNEYYGSMVNYLINGLPPGSFFTAFLANDLAGALRHSHPANNLKSLQNLSSWVQVTFPVYARGSNDKVEAWLGMSDSDRRKVLEDHSVIYSESDEVIMTLKGAIPDAAHSW